MPCQVDTSHEDNLWRQELNRHHAAVEDILERCIKTGETSWAAVDLEAERKYFAQNYCKIWKNLYNAEALEKGMKKIIGE